MRASAHFWTVAPNLIGRARPTPIVDFPWCSVVGSVVRDGVRTPAVVAGRLGNPHGSKRLALVVHGLGGDVDSPYVRDIVASAQQRGWATLRISMRGAGASSPDFYHAGLSDDLAAILASESLHGFDSIVVIGCSLGGHIALHLARACDDTRVVGVVAICSPLDLGPNAGVLDAPRSWIYRRHILAGLESMHTKVHGGRERFASIRDWDARVVVPRWGFDDVDQYWSSQSMGPRLTELRLPALYVGASGDPMVPAEFVRPHLERAPSSIDARWVERAGHMGFAPGADLGMGGPVGVWAQVLSWSERLAP